MAYTKRYALGFTDGDSSKPADSVFLNNVEAALLALLGVDATADGQALLWKVANSRYEPALIKNAHIDPAAAIARSKLGALNIVDADIIGGANIAKSKLAALHIVDADVDSISVTKITGGAAVLARKSKLTSKAVNTTVAATDLLNAEISLDANTFLAGKKLRFVPVIDWLNNTGGGVVAPRLQLIVGGTTIFDTGATALNFVTSANRAYLFFEVEAIALTDATQVWRASLKITGAVGASGSPTMTLAAWTTGVGERMDMTDGANHAFIIGTAMNTSSLDMTSSKTVVLNVINGSASASYETRLQGAMVDIT